MRRELQTFFFGFFGGVLFFFGGGLVYLFFFVVVSSFLLVFFVASFVFGVLFFRSRFSNETCLFCCKQRLEACINHLFSNIYLRMVFFFLPLFI